jgi:hypothetical protein
MEAARGKASAQGRADVAQGTALTVEIAAYANLLVEGTHRQQVDVPEPDATAKVSFQILGGETPGAGELSVQIRQGSIPLTTMWLLPAIVAKRESDAAPLRTASTLPFLPQNELPLDEIRIIENVNGTAVTYTFLLDLHSLSVREEFISAPLDGPRDAYVMALMTEIGDSWIRNQDKGGVSQFERDIRAIGGKMFSQLLPRGMQEILWEHRDRINSVQVFSREPFIPWELLYLKDPKVGRAVEGNKFLGELGLLRWLYDGFPPSKLRIRRSRVHFLIGDYDDPRLELPDSELETKMLKRIFSARKISASLNDLNMLLEAPDQFDLLHICCHGMAAGAQAAQAQIFLNGTESVTGIDGESLKATTVEETVRLADEGAAYRPIVVLNACESTRPNREFTGMGGFAHAFVRARAGAFIGTHWSVGDAPAFAFVQALYESFASKRKKPITLSEAVTAARQVARGKDDATWLAYVVYGHPRAIVTVE